MTAAWDNVRARVLTVDGAAELVVTDIYSGATLRFPMNAPALTVLVETAVVALTNQLRTDVRLGAGKRPETGLRRATGAD